ncbi:MAG: DMT family transporter, partial [Gemmatimonadaceae bacterium]|nr:DMT family transporter [Gemmatimonadaceae bacterium]
MTAPAAASPAVRSRAVTGTLWLLVSAASFGTTSIIAARGTADGTSLLTLLGWRYVFATAMLAIVAGGWGALRGAGPAVRRLMWQGGAAQAAIAFLSLSALRWIPPATLAFLFYTYPIWVTLLAAVRGSEPLDARTLVAVVLSSIGLAIIVGNPLAGPLDIRGVALAIGAAMLYALLIPWLGRVQQGVAPAVASAWIAAGATVFLWLGMLVARAALLPSAPTPYAWAALMALIPTTLAFIAFLAGLARLGPVRAAIVSTVEPFWTALLAA